MRDQTGSLGVIGSNKSLAIEETAHARDRVPGDRLPQIILGDGIERVRLEQHGLETTGGGEWRGVRSHLRAQGPSRQATIVWNGLMRSGTKVSSLRSIPILASRL